MDMREKALKEHELWRGKLEIKSKVKVNTSEDLAIAYTPGVAEPCKEIEKDIENVYKYTMKSNTIAVVTDGSAVLGLGDIGPEAALPVMEGKCVLFKEFADIDAFPICLDTNDVDEIVNTIKIISPGLGGINLEDISAPRCFEIERRLKQDLKIPVFHDDQHGTAIIVLAGIMNSLKIIKKRKENLKVVISGAGSAGIAIAKILLNFGIKNIILTDRKGILTQMEDNWAKREIADMTNPEKLQGDLSEALINSDIFIGVSAPGIVTKEMIETMNKDAIVFAMANPVPEIMPEEAKAGGARIIGTGRSDFPNQVNNVLAFPGILKGALKARTQITEEMKIAAAKAIAEMIPEEELNEENILPKAFKPGIAENVANAVINAAEK
ncbi:MULTISPECIES: NADP-dependent malic enzyme [Bacteria]|uniref:NADP-dependent malic enzyme n=1 Tax=Geotoga petraea TaxID=28234 RepID=A0A4Z0W647_9BACT|nr:MULTISPECIES: NADP-dependent malic enzyme [Bacteria]PUU87470.1 MAG: malate dehydrogenase (oxaloacetate-decarboxylating) [Halanaerobium sp.]TGG88902.1 NADP-dependent malic enzyme [Geotoga petraea]